MAKNKKAAKPAPKKNAKPAPKKAAKPAAKKPAKPAAKPAAKKKIVKPAPKKAAKPVAKKAAKPAPKKAAKPAKPIAKKAAKPAPKKAVKQAAKPVAKKGAKPAPAPKKAVKPAAKAPAKPEKKVAVKPIKEVKKPISKVETKPAGKAGKKEEKGMKKSKEESKKVKPVDEELEVDDLDIGEGILETDMDVEADIEEEEDDFVDDEPKKKGRKPKVKEVKKRYDSEDFVRKQVVKIDLNKSLLKKQAAEQPKPFVNTTDNRSRYADKELAEFRELILKKLEEAQTDYDLLKQTLSHADDHGTDDTSPTFKLLEDGSDVLSKEETAQLASRQEKYIVSLKNALVRIENKSYGICRATGKLIPKERLRSVPHATLSIDAKLNQYS
ncbi:MAG: molecular chaperone DnaK [Bacteroidetes bacterium]|jgi:RNA polymerase-binding transcription factor DksA|nr:molecular chaperone DnaK [Bacteroidota bacterium]